MNIEDNQEEYHGRCSHPIFEWVNSFEPISDARFDHLRHFVSKAVDEWLNKNPVGVILSLKRSGLGAAEIVHFAMREWIPEEYESAFWMDIKMVLDPSRKHIGYGDFLFHNFDFDENTEK